MGQGPAFRNRGTASGWVKGPEARHFDNSTGSFELRVQNCSPGLTPPSFSPGLWGVSLPPQNKAPPRPGQDQGVHPGSSLPLHRHGHWHRMGTHGGIPRCRVSQATQTSGLNAANSEYCKGRTQGSSHWWQDMGTSGWTNTGPRGDRHGPLSQQTQKSLQRDLPPCPVMASMCTLLNRRNWGHATVLV